MSQEKSGKTSSQMAQTPRTVGTSSQRQFKNYSGPVERLMKEKGLTQEEAEKIVDAFEF